MKKGHTQPVIFGCRQGCDYSDVMKELAHRGLIKSAHISKEEITRIKKETPIPYPLFIWAKTVLDIVADEGCCESDDMDTFMRAVEVLKRAKRNGHTRLKEIV